MFSPNGDGVHGQWEIRNLESYSAAHYIKEGYNVLAVEANPVFVNYCKQKFEGFVQYPKNVRYLRKENRCYQSTSNPFQTL